MRVGDCVPLHVAWTKFAKSESPSNIMRFLESVYTTLSKSPVIVRRMFGRLRQTFSGQWTITGLACLVIVHQTSAKCLPESAGQCGGL